MKLTRLCIYPKDIQRITGKSERYGRKLLSQIKAHYNKQPHQLISITEFCEYTGLKIEDIIKYFQD